MEKYIDGPCGSVDLVGALSLRRRRGLVVTQPTQLIGEIVESEIDADVEMKTIRVDLRREIPFASFEFLGDLVFPVFEKPRPRDQTGGGNDQNNDKADTEDS